MSGEGDVAVACRFVRGRNALLCSADFGPAFLDMYLHLGQNGVVLEGGVDEKFKQLLAAVALHGAAQPRAVTCAWTMHFEEAGLNLFAVAENPGGQLTGQVFNERVRAVGGNVLHAERAEAGGTRRRSAVDFEGDGVLHAAEIFYGQSEQRPARYFTLDGDGFALLAAQPDCDTDWLASVDAVTIAKLAADASVPPLEVRYYRFACGCTPEKIAGAVWPALRGDLEGVFEGGDVIRIACPRCGSRHEIPRSAFDGTARG